MELVSFYISGKVVNHIIAYIDYYYNVEIFT